MTFSGSLSRLSMSHFLSASLHSSLVITAIIPLKAIIIPSASFSCCCWSVYSPVSPNVPSEQLSVLIFPSIHPKCSLVNCASSNLCISVHGIYHFHTRSVYGLLCSWLFFGFLPPIRGSVCPLLHHFWPFTWYFLLRGGFILASPLCVQHLVFHLSPE